MRTEKVTINIATMPERKESLKAVVTILLPQVDQINIYLNNFKGDIPEFLNHDKIRFFESEKEPLGDIGAAGKFYDVENQKGYILTADDDIFYASDYVEKMIEGIERYKRKAVITVHGRILHLDRKSNSYYKDAERFFVFHRGCSEDTKVHVGGTGVMAFHSDTIKISTDDFGYCNMADIYFAIKANSLKIPIMVIKHPDHWLQISDKYDKNYSISRSMVNKDQLQTEIINSVTWIN